jgi:hypothetical protein
VERCCPGNVVSIVQPYTTAEYVWSCINARGFVAAQLFNFIDVKSSRSNSASGGILEYYNYYYKYYY